MIRGSIRAVLGGNETAPLFRAVVGPGPVGGIQEGHGRGAEGSAGDESVFADRVQVAGGHVHRLVLTGPWSDRTGADDPPLLLWV